jgi:hypothetical protein
MILTRSFSRVALLTKDLAKTLVDRYRLNNLKIPEWEGGSVVQWVQHVNQWLHNEGELHGKEDLFTEWMLKSISKGIGRPEDFRFLWAARFYFNNYKSDRFKREVKRLADERGVSINPKNLLDFDLNFLEDVKDLLEKPEVDPRVHQLAEKVPEGSKIIYNDGINQIVEVTSRQAACDLGRGTKWCTSDEDTAEQYLGLAPLYVIYVNGKKTAQIHYGVDLQFMDLRDRPISTISDGLRNALKKTGLFQKMLDSLERIEEDQQIDGGSKALSALVGDNPSPEFINYIASKPGLSVLYAFGPLGGKRFPQGEKAILTEQLTSLWYAEYIIKDRWKQGEPIITSEDYYFQDYIDFLESIGKLDEFWKDYPLIRR